VLRVISEQAKAEYAKLQSNQLGATIAAPEQVAGLRS